MILEGQVFSFSQCDSVDKAGLARCSSWQVPQTRENAAISANASLAALLWGERREMQVANRGLSADRPPIIANIGVFSPQTQVFFLVRPVSWMRRSFIEVIRRD